MTTASRLQPYARGDVWALSAAGSVAMDARAIREARVPQAVLMENAGRAAAHVLHRSHGGSHVVGVVGTGNNGGDALVALRTLAAWGYRASVVLVGDRMPNDPLLHGWPLEFVPDEALDSDDWARLLDAADVIIDGLLGTGVRGVPRARHAFAIERLNESDTPVVALDVPSGIDATTGAVPGVAVRADLTVAFGTPKIGALLHPGRALVGRHVTVEIGFPPLGRDDMVTRVATPEWARAGLPVRHTDSHKNSVGRVLVVGGQPGMGGAVILAARAAFRAGAGVVRVGSAAANRDALHAAVPEAMIFDLSDGAQFDAAVGQSDAILVGPGMGTGPEAVAAIRRVAETGALPLLLDADALNLAAMGEVDLASLGAVRPMLLTPHPGEMARLDASLDSGSGGAVSADVVTRARSAARRYGGSVLLKGAPSVVSDPQGAVTIDTQSSSDLAVAGMGDTLSGVGVALLAQGLDAPTAGAIALFLSGRAAAMADRGAGLTPSDVVERIPDAWREVARPESDLDLPFVTFDAEPAR